MSRYLHRIVLLAVLGGVATGCASSYHAEKKAGGFSRTRLGKNIYQVRDETSPNTSQNTISQFLLRRCAQITLEHQKRYFVISSQSQSNVQDGDNFGYGYGEVIIELLDNNAYAGKTVLDAVTVVNGTNKIAKGQLSAKAEKAYNRFAN